MNFPLVQNYSRKKKLKQHIHGQKSRDLISSQPVIVINKL